MPTDPATVPPLTPKEIAQIVRNTYSHAKHSADLNGASDARVFASVAEWPIEAIRAAYALAAARVDHELKDKRDKVMHMHDLYDALGVEWGRDPFSAIAALKAARVDTAEVERRAKYDALTKLADEWNNAAFGVSGPHLTLNATLHASARMVLEFRDRECPAPAPRECVLSDGSVVTRHDDPRHVWGGWWRRAERDATDSTGWTGTRTWPELMRSTDTGADFDALKRFAAEVGQ